LPNAQQNGDFAHDSVKTIDRKLKNNFLNGVFKDYIEWTEAACNVLKYMGLNKEIFNEVIYNKISILPNVKILFDLLKEQKVKIILINGSFFEIINKIISEVGDVDGWYSHCKLYFDDKGLLDKWDIYPTDYHNKVNCINEVIEKYNISKNI